MAGYSQQAAEDKISVIFFFILVKNNAELLRGKREENGNVKLSPRPETVVRRCCQTSVVVKHVVLPSLINICQVNNNVCPDSRFKEWRKLYT